MLIGALQRPFSTDATRLAKELCREGLEVGDIVGDGRSAQRLEGQSGEVDVCAPLSIELYGGLDIGRSAQGLLGCRQLLCSTHLLTDLDDWRERGQHGPKEECAYRERSAVGKGPRRV